MFVVSPAEFGRLLRGLDGATLAGFVAGLWEARGWETTRAGTLVTATDYTSGRTLRIRCLGGRGGVADRIGRLRRGTRRQRADIVVAARDTRRARGVADRLGARYLGPADLHQLLLYAVPRPRAERLLREHFDRSLAAPNRSRQRSVTPALRAVLLVLVVLAASVVVVDPSGLDAPPTAYDQNGTRSDGGSLETTAEVDPNVGSDDQRFPAGVNDDGVEDAVELAQAHGRVVSGQSYRLLIVYRRSFGPEYDGRWHEVRQTVQVANETTYLSIVEGNLSVPTQDLGDVESVTYADGHAAYTRTARNGSVEYTRESVGTHLGDNGVFADRSQRYIERYLGASRSDLSTVIYEQTNQYLVAVAGEPTRISGNISDYRATAIVAPNGFVSRLEVSYTVTENGETYRVQFEMQYTASDTVTVTPPLWYGDARNRTVPSLPAGFDQFPWGVRGSPQVVPSTNETSADSSV